MRWLILVLVIAGLVFGGWQLTRPKPIPVLLHTIERGEVRATVSNTRVGTVKACSRAKMSPSAAGQVAVLTVNEGDRVSTGQVMMEIWNEDLKAELKQADTDITAAAKRAEESCVQADGSARDANRQRQLAQKHLVAEEAHDNAETRARANRASCAATRAAHAATIARRAVIDQQIEKTRLRAPFAGVVAEINAKLGEFITPSPTGIATLPAIDLIDTSCLYVSAPIDEVDAPQIKAGMSACVTLDAFKGKRCGAAVRRVAPYVLEREKQARTVDVEVELKTPESRALLLPGYSADIEILIGEKKNVLRIPTEALMNGHEVYVYDTASHHLAKREVQTGAANWEFTEIVHGLNVGEQIVTSVGRKGVKDSVLAKPDDGSDDAD